MHAKRLLSLLLCVSVVLSCAPVLGQTVVAEESAQAAAVTTRIEAEDTTYAVWNKYTAVDTGATEYSEGGGAGTMQNGTYPAFDIADSTEDLAAGFIDKSNLPYVAFYVDVPAAGTYSLATASYFKFKAEYENAYAVFLVNPNDPRQETVTYQGYYGAVTGTHYLTTQGVQAQLQEGRNVIYVISATSDQNLNWANIDYLDITGPQEVTPVAANAQTLYAGDAPYTYGFATLNAGGSVGGGNWGDLGSGKLPITSMSAANADALRGITYTVNAPADGYYDMTVSYNSMQAGADSMAIGFLVDGVAQAREFTFHTGGNKTKGYIDLSVYLSEGNHVLTITAPANRTSAETASNADWCDYAELLLYGGLIQATVQSNPKMEWWYAEAEYQTEGYALWHGFNATDAKRANTFRDYNNSNYKDYQVKCGIGGGNAVNNYSLAQLQEGRLDKGTTTGVTIYVEAPEAGSYDFYAYYYLKCPGIWDSTNSVLTETPYSVFMVNGEFGAKANFLASGYDWSYNTETVQLNLEKGLNEITFIPQTADQYKSSSDWAVVDCIFVDTDLQVAKVPTESVTVNVGKGISYLFTNNTTTLEEASATSFTYGNYEMADSENLSAATITKEDLYKLCFVSYTVEAPYDGYYDISMAYGSHANNTMADYAFALLVDDRASEIKHLVNDGAGTVDISTYLTKGTHTLTVPNILPIDAARASAKNMNYTNMDAVTFGGGLTLADTQIDPLTEGMTVLEAESDAAEKVAYGNTSSAWFLSGGSGVGRSTDSNITTDQIKQHMPAGDRVYTQPYVEYIVEAPEAGSYELKIGVRLKFASGVDSVIYLQVNGEILEVPFNATNNTSKYVCFCLPATVELAAGRNVIRVLGPTKTQTSGSWIDQDYLAVPAALKSVAPVDMEQTRPAVAAFKGNYTNRNIGAANDRLDLCLVSDISLSELSLENFRSVSWHSLTVEAPADGYYPVQATMVAPAQESANLAKIGVLVNGAVCEAKFWQSSNVTVVAEAFIYLEKGTHDLIFTGMLADSNVLPNAANTSEYWLDAEYVHLGGGLTKAQTQRYPVEGLVDGSGYTLTGSALSGVFKDTTVRALKSNFYGEVTVTSSGVTLEDEALVPNGAKIAYASGTVYTVTTYNKGDVTGDGIIDIRDMKHANEYLIGNASENSETDIIGGENGVDDADLTEYSDIIFGKTDADVFYQPHSMGAADILALGNPVGRLLNYRSAVFMESSASGFTMTGDLKGDVSISLRAERGKSKGGTACIYVEVDGEVSEFAFPVNTDQVLTIASDLPAGDHTIKITKGTDAKYDMLYVSSVSYNGTLTRTEAADLAIEYLGDSITVGFGLYEPDVSLNNTMSGSYYSYANVAADLLGADHYTIGNGAWRFGENTGAAGDTRYLGYIYEKNSMNLDLGAYDFAWQPDVVVISLGTNDANQYTLQDNGGELDQAVWSEDMAALLTTVRTHNPNAKLYWVFGAMEEATTIDKSIVLPLIENAIAAYNTASGDNVTYVHVTNDISGVYDHPTREGQQVIGSEVANAISAGLAN